MARIVFCEDEMLIQKLFRVMLRFTDHELYLASNGTEGLELVERVRPDLIFTDISMPGCDGYQFADAVKARPYLAAIPIIFVSAFAQQSEMEEGFRHGGASYIIKPFSAADLYEKIERFCNQKIPPHVT
jgi:two-component system response regulator MtrA